MKIEIPLVELPSSVQEEVLRYSPRCTTVYTEEYTRKGVAYTIYTGCKGSIDGFPVVCRKN